MIYPLYLQIHSLFPDNFACDQGYCANFTTCNRQNRHFAAILAYIPIIVAGSPEPFALFYLVVFAFVWTIPRKWTLQSQASAIFSFWSRVTLRSEFPESKQDSGWFQLLIRRESRSESQRRDWKPLRKFYIINYNQRKLKANGENRNLTSHSSSTQPSTYLKAVLEWM